MNETTQRCGQIYKALRVGDDASSLVGEGICYGSRASDMMSYLSLLRLWFACTVEGLAGNVTHYLRGFEARALQEAADIAADIRSGKTRAPALIPESARAPEAPKIMLGRSTKRMLARGLPISRQYGWFRYASSRTLNGNQFFELLGRLSVHGRASLYRLEYRLRLCQRRSQTTAVFVSVWANTDSISMGLSPHHLWPD